MQWKTEKATRAKVEEPGEKSLIWYVRHTLKWYSTHTYNPNTGPRVNQKLQHPAPMTAQGFGGNLDTNHNTAELSLDINSFNFQAVL